ncbi:MAG: DnaJ domain-containing protein [Verrucomicrobia bacterium]|nr:DnaJ domain-containing protein [Verrucomicrobiota bacterium]
MAVQFKDYYEILGVPRTASAEEIRKAFRKLARRYHPDVARNKAAAEEKFKEINEAYEVLGDPKKREQYDELGANWNRMGSFTPPPRWKAAGRSRRGNGADSFEFHFGGTGFSDFFEQFFGGRAGGFGPFPSSRQEAGGDWLFGEPETDSQRGNDVEGGFLVTLHEALHGSVRSVSLQRENPRTGRTETHTFRVKIPPGVREGQLVRVAGKGQASDGVGLSGDLYLRVKYAQHPDFRVREPDLYCDLELAPWEAVLGTTATVPTLDGAVSLRVPAGISSGRQLRIRGQGLLEEHGVRGDLYAVISIQAPSRLTPEEKALWEKLAGESTFNPRAP